MMLCSLANFRTSVILIDGIRYTIVPGEWLMPIRELTSIFRLKTDRATVAVLDYLRDWNYLTFVISHRGRYVKFKINNWEKFNTVVEANAPCQKD